MVAAIAVGPAPGAALKPFGNDLGNPSGKGPS